MMNDIDYMKLALIQAQLAQDLGEVPVGAVLVKGDNIIAEGFNQPITSLDPTGHAEIVAIRKAAHVENNYRLINTTLYVTLEPCVMCLGAIMHARINRLVFGADDPKCAILSGDKALFNALSFNHRLEWEGGVLLSPCADMLLQFFKSRR